MATMWKLLALLAVLLMPLGMTPAAATSADPQTSASMPIGHCDEQAPKHGSRHGLAECTMACSAALPATDAPGEELPLIACLPIRPVAAQVLHGLHPETATPPPKSF